MTFFNRKLSDCSEINHLVENGKLIEFLRWIADHFDSFEIRTIENILPIVEKTFRTKSNDHYYQALQFSTIVFVSKPLKFRLEKQEKENSLRKL